MEVNILPEVTSSSESVENISSIKVLGLGLTRVGNVICGNSEEAYIQARKACIQFVYKNCTRCIQLMYTRYIQNVSHISTNFCIQNVYKIKRTMAVKICIQNVYKRLLKCGIHFVFIVYTFCIREF